jgi:hypothetical protein
MASRSVSVSKFRPLVAASRSAVFAVAMTLLPAIASAQNGFVTGTVTSAATTTPLEGVTVAFCTPSISCTFGAITNSSGMFTFSAPAGTYYAFTLNSIGYVDEIYDNIQCPGSCPFSQSVFSGTPIGVVAGGTTSNINFALEVGGEITGRVTNATTSAGLGGVGVAAYFRAASGGPSSARSVLTDSSGLFRLNGLPDGTYYLVTSNFQGYVNEIYDNIPCLGSCSSTTAIDSGTPIAVTSGTSVNNRDFALDPGGTITGVIRNAASSAALSSVSVHVYAPGTGSSPTFVTSGFTNSSGIYTANGLPTGTYYVLTSNTQGFVDEIFDNIPCVGSCSSTTAVASGTGIPVTVGAVTSGRNFDLDFGGSITGTVTNASASGIAGAFVSIYARIAGASTFVNSATVQNASGVYSVGGLPSGTYYAVARAANYIGEIYDDIPCLGSCSSTAVTAAGAPIPVTLGSATSDRNFQLDAGGAIAGTVTDAATSSPLANVFLDVYRSTGSGAAFVGSASTNSSGAYSAGGLPSGTYYLLTSGSSTAYVNQIYSGIVCPGSCSSSVAIASGTPITVAAGATTSGRNFALSQGGEFSGVITSGSTGTPIPFASVNVYSRIGDAAVFARSTSTNATGGYTARGLPSGTYYAYTGASGFTNEIFDNVPCLVPGACSGANAITNGTGIAVTAGATTTGRNFALQPVSVSNTVPAAPTSFQATVMGGTVVFSWFAPSTAFAAAATSYVLQIGLVPGTTLVSFTPTSTTYTATGAPPGRFYARVRGVNANGMGPASDEFELMVNADGSGVPAPPTGLVVFMEGTRLRATWGLGSGGGVVTDFVLEVGTGTGRSDIAALPVGNRAYFTYDPVPPGVYFFRVRARNASSVSSPSDEVLLNVGDVPGPPGAPTNFDGAVSPGRVVTLGWTAPRGPVTHYILEAGTASRLSDVIVFNTGSPATTLSFAGVPPGRYFVRLRAVNAAGMSIVSSEFTLVVP